MMNRTSFIVLVISIATYGCDHEYDLKASSCVTSGSLVACDMSMTRFDAGVLCEELGGEVLVVRDLARQQEVADFAVREGLEPIWWSGHGRTVCEAMGSGGGSSRVECDRLIGVVCEVTYE